MRGTWMKITLWLGLLCGCGGAEAPAPMVADDATMQGQDSGMAAPVEKDAMMPPDAALEPNTIAVKSLAVGSHYACGLLLDDTISCWGEALMPDKLAPEGLVFERLEAGNSNLCGILSDGTARCWGQNDVGQADNPEQTVLSYIDPGGGTQGCLVDLEGQLVCWGNVTQGAPDLSGVSLQQVVAGADHTCVLTTDGEVLCWGMNGFGEIDAPAGQYKFLDGTTSVNCALTMEGAPVCWGRAAEPPSEERFVTMSVGYTVSCGLRADGTAVCWGIDTFGALDVPDEVWSEVQVKNDFVCGVRKVDQRVLCWGRGSQGQTDVPLAE